MYIYIYIYVFSYYKHNVFIYIYMYINIYVCLLVCKAMNTSWLYPFCGAHLAGYEKCGKYGFWISWTLWICDFFLFSCKESEIPIVSGQNQGFFNGAIPVGNTRVWCLVEAHAILAHLATQSSLLNGTQGTLTGTSEISSFLGDLPNPVSSCFMTMYYELVSSSSSPEDNAKCGKSNAIHPAQ